jgi:S1-C subfamily serine protease
LIDQAIQSVRKENERNFPGFILAGRHYQDFGYCFLLGASEEGTGTLGGLWGKRSVRVTAVVTAALLGIGVGLGVTSAMHGSVPADARIPQPPAKNDVFVEDDNGAGADQQGNILQSSAAGVLSIRSASGTALGAGFVITRSGFVLASYHGLQDAGTISVRFVMSGKTYPARLVGSDPEANLALLQLSGGTEFTPVSIGTTAGVQLNDRPVTLDGKRLTGLLEVSSLSEPASELGGPLFNLSDQVLGLSVGSGTRGGVGDGYVVPIDSALQLARQIAGQ